jgi:trehalose 6-phosphate phosphatase
VNDRQRILAWVAGWLAEGGRVLLISDYDGTLSPIVREPAKAWLPADVRHNLRALSGCPHVRLAIISGRDLCDLRARVGVTDAIYGGCHGLEVDGPDMAFSHPDAEAQQESLRMISLALNQRAQSVAGMRVEAKRLGVALHYRDVPDDQLRQVEVELSRAIQRSGHRLKIFHGSKVLEVLPQVAWNKGQCARWIVQSMERLSPQPLMTLYMGDDWTDEQAFEALACQAITIKVGGAAPISRAHYRFPDVGEVQALVAGFAGLAEVKGAA